MMDSHAVTVLILIVVDWIWTGFKSSHAGHAPLRHASSVLSKRVSFHMRLLFTVIIASHNLVFTPQLRLRRLRKTQKQRKEMELRLSIFAGKHH